MTRPVGGKKLCSKFDRASNFENEMYLHAYMCLKS